MHLLNRIGRNGLRLLLLLLPLALAAEETESPPVYDIEVVIFARDGGTGSEQWPLDPGRPATEGAIPMSRLNRLGRGSWRLTAEGYALSRSQGYRPLLHLAWRQPVLGRQRARPILVRSQEQIAAGYPELEGTLRISVARYLHLDLDLLLRDPARADSDGDFRAYRFSAHRRMRSGELHYIDHPRLGVLIRIDKAPAQTQAKTTVPADADTPLNGQDAAPSSADAPSPAGTASN